MKTKLIISVVILSLFNTNIYASNFRFILSDKIKPAFSSADEANEAKTYCDTDGLWCESSAKRLFDEGLFEGIKIGKNRYFQPDVEITRGDFLLYLETVAPAQKSEADAAPFEDFALIPYWQRRVIVDMYNAKVIRGAVEGGKLYSNFDENISRLEAALIISNALNLEKGTDVAYTDSYLIPKYASEGIASVTKSEIMKGFSDGSFRPYIKVTRAMLADMICNIEDFKNRAKK